MAHNVSAVQARGNHFHKKEPSLTDVKRRAYWNTLSKIMVTVGILIALGCSTLALLSTLQVFHFSQLSSRIVKVTVLGGFVLAAIGEVVLPYLNARARKGKRVGFTEQGRDVFHEEEKPAKGKNREEYLGRLHALVQQRELYQEKEYTLHEQKGDIQPLKENYLKAQVWLHLHNNSGGVWLYSDKPSDVSKRDQEEFSKQIIDYLQKSGIREEYHDRVFFHLLPEDTKEAIKYLEDVFQKQYKRYEFYLHHSENRWDYNLHHIDKSHFKINRQSLFYLYQSSTNPFRQKRFSAIALQSCIIWDPLGRKATRQDTFFCVPPDGLEAGMTKAIKRVEEGEGITPPRIRESSSWVATALRVGVLSGSVIAGSFLALALISSFSHFSRLPLSPLLCLGIAGAGGVVALIADIFLTTLIKGEVGQEGTSALPDIFIQHWQGPIPSLAKTSEEYQNRLAALAFSPDRKHFIVPISLEEKKDIPTVKPSYKIFLKDVSYKEKDIKKELRKRDVPTEVITALSAFLSQNNLFFQYRNFLKILMENKQLGTTLIPSGGDEPPYLIKEASREGLIFQATTSDWVLSNTSSRLGTLFLEMERTYRSEKWEEKVFFTLSILEKKS